MNAEPDISRIARTIGDPTRIRMLTLLMEGRALTAKELAYGAGVGPATGTAHLRKLLADSLVAARTQGRHKYFRLSSEHVAHCVESLMFIAKPAKAAGQLQLPPIQQARFCYDHLAGRVAIEITQVLLAKKLMQLDGEDFTLSRKGERWFTDFGVDLATVSRTRRRFAYSCLDWSERKDHLGGALGAALAQRMLDLGWLKRIPDTRIASITTKGRRALVEHFGITLAASCGP